MRRALALVAVAGVAAGCGGGHSTERTITGSSRLTNFALADADGGRLSFDSLRGRYVLVAFLYTHCTDVCPLIAENIGDTLRAVDSPKVTAIAISVDPAGDTPAAVRRFVRAHHAQLRYLIGTRDELAPVWQEFNVLVERQSTIRTMHDAPVFVVDPDGRPVLVEQPTVSARRLTADVRRLLG